MIYIGINLKNGYSFLTQLNDDACSHSIEVYSFHSAMCSGGLKYTPVPGLNTFSSTSHCT